jgi:hypothetical protein
MRVIRGLILSSVDKNDDLHGEKAAIEQSEVLVNTDLMNDAFAEKKKGKPKTQKKVKIGAIRGSYILDPHCARL